METPPTKFPARPEPNATLPQIVAGAVAGAVAARLRKDNPVASIEPGSEFDRLMREKLARFEQASK